MERRVMTVREVNRVVLVLRGWWERLAERDQREILVHRDHLVVHRDRRVHEVLKEKKVRKEFVVCRELLVHRVHKVIRV